MSMTGKAIFDEKKLGAMASIFGTDTMTWEVATTVEGESATVEVEVEGIRHRHQTERNREQKPVYSAEGEIPQPNICYLVKASDLEGKPWQEEDRPLSRGTAVTVALPQGDVVYRVGSVEFSADESHWVVALTEEAT